LKIEEVPIGPNKTSRKNISPKIHKQTEEYLSTKGLLLEQLSEEQKQCVFKHIKVRKALKWSILVASLSSLIFLVLAFFGTNLLYKIAHDSIPDSTVIELEDGTKKVVELDRELIGHYGLVCGLFGALGVGLLYTSASGITNAITSIISFRNTKKIFDAFLPSLRNPNIDELENRTSLER
jgi:hypothetical protein